jgi:thioredoxin 1
MGLKQFDSAAQAVAQSVDEAAAPKAINRAAAIALQLGLPDRAKMLLEACKEPDAATLETVKQALQAEAQLPVPLDELLHSASASGGATSSASADAAADAAPASAAAAWERLQPLLRIAPHADRYLCAACRTLIAQRKYDGAARMARALLLRNGVEGALTRELTLPLSEGSSIILPKAELPSAAVLLAEALMGIGELQEATTVLQRALTNDPDSNGEARGAVPLLKLAKQLNERKEAGNALFKAGDNAGALAAYEEGAKMSAAQFSTGLSVFHSNAAAALSALGRGPEAKAALVRSLKAYPGAAKTFNKLATMLSRDASTLEAAEQSLVAYSFLAPDDSAVSKTLMQLRAKTGTEPPLLHLDSDKDLQAAMRPQAAHGRRLVVLDVFATWCGPCKQIAPVFEKLSLGHAVPLFCKSDSDKAQGPFLATAGVRALPTFLVFLDGKEVGRLEGADPNKLDELVREGIAQWKRTPPPLPASAPAAASSPVLAEAFAALEMRPDVVKAVKTALTAIEE